MKTKLALLMCLGGALAALVGTDAPLAARAWSGIAFHNRSAAKELPRGLTLPSSDADLKASSLVAADLDADGDLDIVASQHVRGSVDLVVWENDGAGRLTRRQPAPPKRLRGEPSTPALDDGTDVTAVPIQPDAPAIAAVREAGWLTLPALTCERPRAPDAVSADRCVLRSRSPPRLS